MSKELHNKIAELEESLKKAKNQETEPSQEKQDKAMGQKVFAEIVGGVLFGVIFGLMLDEYFNTAPIFLLILIILGLAGSVYNIYKATK
jgi:F0F1-type ATP synthase assembly protein I